ncbi:GCN5-related N-acetyltransferase [Sphingomonas sp.]|uniref:GCN5-related N-acetyltransferase n=1 Tax=Sphingomonas sp. TaxID=28214 RepID=UPI0035C849C8
MTRAALEQRWLTLTRELMPTLASECGWPVRNDHCFQRILLDAAVGGCWYDAIPQRPAYRHAEATLLARAIDLGEAVVAGEADLAALNRQSLAWRGKASR